MRVLTKKQLAQVVRSLPKPFIWHDFQAGTKRSQQGFCVVVREDQRIRGSIHVSAQGEVHAFTQNSQRNEVMSWTSRYKFKTVAELEKKYQELLKKILKTTRTKL